MCARHIQMSRFAIWFRCGWTNRLQMYVGAWQKWCCDWYADQHTFITRMLVYGCWANPDDWHASPDYIDILCRLPVTMDVMPIYSQIRLPDGYHAVFGYEYEVESNLTCTKWAYQARDSRYGINIYMSKWGKCMNVDWRLDGVTPVFDILEYVTLHTSNRNHVVKPSFVKQSCLK